MVLALQLGTTELGAPWILCTAEDVGEIASSPNYAAVKVQMTY